MKRLFCLTLVLCLACTLFGCSGLSALELPPLPNVDSASDASEAEVENSEELQPADGGTLSDEAGPSAEEAELANHVIVNVTSYGETFMDPQNGTEKILEFSYELPAVYVEGRDDAGAAINEHIAALAETYQTGNDYGYGSSGGLNSFLEMATDNYTYIVNSGEENLPMLFHCSQTVKVSRADERVLSLRYTTASYTGGAHGNHVDRAYSFDTESGERVTMDMLASDTDSLRSFLLEYMLSLYETDENEYYSLRVIEDFLSDGTLADAFAALLREGSWYLGENGLVIFSDIYELGPYAAGICEFVVPYDALTGKIDPRWMPSEKSGEGSFKLMRQSELAEGSAQIIDRVSVDEDGEQLCLVAEGVVYDVRLSSVAYMDKFYETAQLWACSYMKDCLLQLDVTIPEGMPNLMVRYTDASGELHSLILTQSGEDGSFILADDDIEAVG